MIICHLTHSLFLHYAFSLNSEGEECYATAFNLQSRRELKLDRCYPPQEAHKRLLLLCLHDYLKRCPNACVIRRLSYEGDTVAEGNQKADDLFGGELAGMSLRKLVVNKQKYRQSCREVLGGSEAVWVGRWIDLDGREMELATKDRLIWVGDLPVSVVEWQRVS